MSILKYTLKITDIQTLYLPLGAQILSIANQHGLLCLWAMVDIEETKTEAALIEIVGIGQSMLPADRHFLGTVLIDTLVWHVFTR